MLYSSSSTSSTDGAGSDCAGTGSCTAVPPRGVRTGVLACQTGSLGDSVVPSSSDRMRSERRCTRAISRAE